MLLGKEVISNRKRKGYNEPCEIALELKVLTWVHEYQEKYVGKHVSKVNITSKNINSCPVSHDTIHQEGHIIIYLIILPKHP